MRDSDLLKSHLEGHGPIQDALRRSDVTRRDGWRAQPDMNEDGWRHWRIWCTRPGSNWERLDTTSWVRLSAKFLVAVRESVHRNLLQRPLGTTRPDFYWRALGA